SEFLAKFSKQLFSALVKVTAGELSPSERFRIDMGEKQSIGRLLPAENEKLALHNLPTMRAFVGDKEARADNEEVRSSIKPSSILELEANRTALLSACQSLLHSLDNELDRLKRLEREGFRLEDMKIVEQALSRSGQIRNLIDQVKSSVESWQQLP